MATDNVTTPVGRLAFPSVFEKKAAPGSTREMYSINLIFPKDTDLMPLRKILHQAVVEKWGPDKTKWPMNLQNIDFKTFVSPTGKDGFPIRDGDAVPWDGYAGNVFIRASSALYKPGVVDKNRQAVMDREDVFGGLLARANINAFAYDASGNKGVSFGLQHLQILKDDGTRYSGQGKAEEAFDEWKDDADDWGSTGTDDDLPF